MYMYKYQRDDVDELRTKSTAGPHRLPFAPNLLADAKFHQERQHRVKPRPGNPHMRPATVVSPFAVL